jgi:hypothetical protein
MSCWTNVEFLEIDVLFEADPPREAYRLVDILGLSVHQEQKLTRDQMRKKVAESVMALREAQYKASEL